MQNTPQDIDSWNIWKSFAGQPFKAPFNNIPEERFVRTKDGQIVFQAHRSLLDIPLHLVRKT